MTLVSGDADHCLTELTGNRHAKTGKAASKHGEALCTCCGATTKTGKFSVAERTGLTKLLHHFGVSVRKRVLVTQIKLRGFIPKHTLKYVKMVVLITLKA